MESFKKCCITNSLAGAEEDVVGINAEVDDSNQKVIRMRQKC